MELIGKEDIKLSKKQLNELIDLMEKEEVLDVENQIQKVLQKESKKLKKTTKVKEIMKDDSNSTFSATPITPEKKFGEEEINVNVCSPNKKYAPQQASLRENEDPSELKTDANSDSLQNSPITPSVSSGSNKVEGSKHL